jgi:hypothetical protein
MEAEGAMLDGGPTLLLGAHGEEVSGLDRQQAHRRRPAIYARFSTNLPNGRAIEDQVRLSRWLYLTRLAGINLPY